VQAFKYLHCEYVGLCDATGIQILLYDAYARGPSPLSQWLVGNIQASNVDSLLHNVANSAMVVDVPLAFTVDL
jgi:hypothetical protein